MKREVYDASGKKLLSARSNSRAEAWLKENVAILNPEMPVLIHIYQRDSTCTIKNYTKVKCIKQLFT